MTPEKCAVFFHEGRTQVLYALGSELVEAAESYIPEGVPFVVMDTRDLPGRETRDSWVFDYSEPSGFGQNTTS